MTFAFVSDRRKNSLFPSLLKTFHKFTFPSLTELNKSSSVKRERSYEKTYYRNYFEIRQMMICQMIKSLLYSSDGSFE